jgi:hypothetical protein
MTRGAADRIDNVRDWGYFDKYNENTDYEDDDLKNMILNNNTNNNHNYELEEEDCDEDCNKDILLKIFLKHRHIKF